MSNDLPTISLMEPQVEFLMDDTTKFLGLLGGYRSGKTYVACIKAIRLASLNIGLNGLFLEPTYSMVAGVAIPTFEEVFETLGWKSVKTEGQCWYELYSSQTHPRIVMHFPQGDTTVFFRSSENWERIRGFSIAWFIADEFDTSGYELCHQSWQKMVARLTHGKVIQGCVVSTKEGFQWAYKFFVESAGPDRKMIDIYVKNNPFIDDGYIETMKQQLSPKQFEAYVNNEFINFAEGNVYYAYDRIQNRSSETLEKHPNAPLNLGIDFNVGKMATTIGVIIGRQTHIVAELYGAANTEALINDIKRLVGRRSVTCFVDSSGNSEQSNFTSASRTDVAQLKAAFGNDNVKHYKGHIPIPDRVGAVNAQFCNAQQKRNLFINDAKCPLLTRCIETQGFVDGKPDKANDIDHLPDGLGYFISYVFPPFQHRAKVTPLNWGDPNKAQ